MSLASYRAAPPRVMFSLFRCCGIGLLRAGAPMRAVNYSHPPPGVKGRREEVETSKRLGAAAELVQRCGRRRPAGKPLVGASGDASNRQGRRAA